MNRRRFLIQAGHAFPVFAGALYIAGCDSNSDSVDNDDSNNNNPPTVLRATSTVSSGHSHSAEIPVSDLTSSSNKTYDASNSGGHIHMVTLSAAQLVTLGSGTPVTVTSTIDSGHSHQFTFELAS